MAATTRARSKAQSTEVARAQIPPTSSPAITKPSKTTSMTISKKASAVRNHLKNTKAAALNATKSTSAKKLDSPSLFKTSPRSRCLAGGPKGPKVYDDLGFELSYEACAGISRGGICRPRGKKYYDMEDERARERTRQREIMGTERNNVSALTFMAWNDRVARELGIPYHKVEMKHFEELAKRGFVGKEGEFEAVNMSEEERNRLSKLCTGAAFRA
ncbi:hypothetical protein BGZ57DRAFT_349304 [Hyaloscypha finlandica]|nr:hypothetical protein BGZ57DRAFT_349304 [Hyaloscypha finlandica]